MANEEQLRILKEEGIEAWNRWREDNPDVAIDLSRINFRDADLTNVNFYFVELFRTDIVRANLRGANLRGANLKRVQALATNFAGATLTGACIQDWNINTYTNLHNTKCDYIYLKAIYSKEKKEYTYSERRPSDPNKNFEPGEFAALVQKSVETVDLIFKNGIDWKAFLSSYQDIQVKYGNENVSIQAIDKKSDGAFVIRLNVPPDANKAEIESYAKQSYETKLKVLEAQYREKLQAKYREIEIYKEKSADILELAKLAASRPITVEAKAVAENQSKNVEVEMNFQAPVTGAAGKVSGDMNVYASEQKQTLAEAAAEIQKLLKQLEQTNPSATEAQQIEHINDETTPKFKRKAVAALKAAGDTAIDEFLDNSYVKVGKAAIMGWMDA